MTDQFMEEATVKQNRGMETAVYIIAWVMMIIFAVIAFFELSTLPSIIGQYGFAQCIPDIILFVAAGGCAALLWFRKDSLRTEYEYTITNAQMDFAAVYNNVKRKALGTMNLKNIAACGEVASGSFNRYINTPGVKRSNWFVNREAKLFYIYFQKEDTKRIIIIEPSDEMKEMIKRAVTPGVYQVN